MYTTKGQTEPPTTHRLATSSRGSPTPGNRRDLPVTLLAFALRFPSPVAKRRRPCLLQRPRPRASPTLPAKVDDGELSPAR